MLTTANVPRPKAMLEELSSRGVPSSPDVTKSLMRLSSPMNKLLRSYLSSIVSPQRSVSPMHGSKLPIIAGMSATL